MEREQFTFYASFAKAIQRIRKAADRAAAYDAIVNYALYEKEPDLDKLPDSVCIVFDLIRPNLDTSRRKAQGGKATRQAEDTAKINARQAEDTGNKYKKEKEVEIENKKENEIEIEYESIDFNHSSLPDDARVITTAAGEKFSVDELRDRVRRIMRSEVPV